MRRAGVVVEALSAAASGSAAAAGSGVAHASYVARDGKASMAGRRGRRSERGVNSESATYEAVVTRAQCEIFLLTHGGVVWRMVVFYWREASKSASSCDPRSVITHEVGLRIKIIYGGQLFIFLSGAHQA